MFRVVAACCPVVLWWLLLHGRCCHCCMVNGGCRVILGDRCVGDGDEEASNGKSTVYLEVLQTGLLNSGIWKRRKKREYQSKG